MKILFSPSEGKNLTKIISTKDNFEFLDALPLSTDIVKDNFLQYLEILKEDDNVISKLFGTKSLKSKSLLDEMTLCLNIAKSSTQEAIRLYQGVAYKALDFPTLPDNAQKYILENVLIFSNLFGMIRAGDKLPFYKYNQNFKYGGFGVAQFYKKLAPMIDIYLENQKVLDLRAEIYIKAYPLKYEHTQIEFLKNGKKVSHYAKYYRGIYLKEISQKQCDKFEDIEIEGLKFVDTKHHKNTTILSYEIIS
ncbi:peroxide stress protein YaaA [Helicobacter cappadocius]|uniref:Peroxide stress protein YaaA n=1 Tax=Helicobacter cappadocius TaxID=3063998 RepID=A0AA90PUX7_9HELI|nr:MULTISPECIES: peroxide stress protein YaaA [unclassified Helicobacter]MDO7253036.1 peroxide stress protein YaaA [Helicobacter sp. faydin-H75]MDP2538975.1 peroxide stress protein YaaA [Helicobacter sp. faydin-H76]